MLAFEAFTKQKAHHRADSLLGGEGGIRTLGTVAGSLVFETSQFNHSCTSPRRHVRFCLVFPGRQKLRLTATFLLAPIDSVAYGSLDSIVMVARHIVTEKLPIISTSNELQFMLRLPLLQK